MTRITEELLRKRAEHNNGGLQDLKEITLHQFEIEKIELLGTLCRQLEILYLQNNLISKIENLHRLKNLKYLNLAINNITKIENLGTVESLQKLDFTANFIEDLLSVESLKDNYNLKELFLVGNPCTKLEGYRQFVVATLLQLHKLDGSEISRSERIEALQNLPAIRARLAAALQPLPNTQSENAYTPEERTKIYKDLSEKRGDAQEEEEKKPKLPAIPPPPAPGETARGINQGKVDFSLTEDAENNCFVLDIACGKYLDTSMIDVDVQPTYIRVIIKGKLLQFPFPEEVCVDKGIAKRSTITGNLVVTVPKIKPILKPTKPTKPKQGSKTDDNQINSKPEAKNQKLSSSSKSVDIYNIIPKKEEPPETPLITEHVENHIEKMANLDLTEIDENEVPPLE